MPTLRELQSGFVDFIVGEKADDLAGAIEPDGIDPVRLLSIYRNNTMITLTETLAAVYPVVRRLVDPRFFDYAAGTFIASNLPSRPCLSEYGSEFSAFLSLFPPANGLPYLPDVAGLEWAISRVMRSEPEVPIGLTTIARTSAGTPRQFGSVSDRACDYIASKYPMRVRSGSRTGRMPTRRKSSWPRRPSISKSA